jgi:serine/threonine protein kinase
MADAAERLSRLATGDEFAGYRIEGLLDRGGMGVVYRATDVDLDRMVALKIIAPEHTTNPDAVRRFKGEARLAASLEHPNIVPIHRGGEFDGVLYLAMRYVPGTNLRQVVDQGPLELDRIQRVITSVASALDAAHERGLVHRDVKPANILLSGDPDHEHVYLTDFGLTKRLGSAGSLTRTGAWVGTPDYVAPEQIQAAPVDGRADIYSLGCVLYEMLTGSVAFPRDNDMAKLWAHISEPPPSPSLKRPDLDPAFDEIVRKATAKNPDDRYAKASELAAAVDEAIGHRASKIEPVPPPTPIPATPHEVFATEPAYAPPPQQTDPAPAGPTVLAERGGGDAGPPSDGAGPSGGGAPPAGGPSWFSRHRWPVLGGAALLVVAVVAAVLLAGGSSDDSSKKKNTANLGTKMPAALDPVPTNRVNADGNATIHLNRQNVATVSLRAGGLLDAAPHAMHIHAGGKGECPPVSAAHDHNGHLSISTTDGVPFYGHPLVALTNSGDTSPASILEFQRFPKTGRIVYSRRFRIPATTARLIRENKASVIVHGIDYNGNGVYDGTLGVSELNAAMNGETTAPALCGHLTPPAKTTASRNGTGGGVYTASLTLTAADAPRFVCLLHS